MQAQVASNIKTQTYFSDPALSPDGKELAFVSGGDIWTAAAIGGEARLLVSHPAMESRPMYSPDGKKLAFVSTRSGNGDIYILDMGTGVVTRLTFDDGNEELSAWSKDGQYIYFSSTSQDIAGMRDVFRVKVTGGTPMIVSGDRYVNEYFATPSPDGKTIALSARGFGSHQWWRQGRSHLDESEIWLLNEKEGKYTRVAEKGARQLWPMWSTDGKTLYYVSDRDGQQNLWMQPVGGTASKLTTFTKGRVLWPSIAANGNTIVFERDFAIWKYDLNTKEAKPIALSLRGAPAGVAVEQVRLNSGFSNLELSPDGKKLAFVAHGDVFVAGTKDGGDATRVTNTAGMESELVWTKNSNAVIYVSDRDNQTNIYQYHFLTGKETQLTKAMGDEGGLTLSVDGKKLAFIRNRNELHVLDLVTQKDVLLTKGNFNFSPIGSGGTLSWSPNGQWIAFASYGQKSLRNISVVSAQGGEEHPVSFLANVFGGEVLWGRDGKSILFITGQRTENSSVARVDLQPRQPRFREDQFRDLFTEPQPLTTTPTPAVKSDPVIDSMSSVTKQVDGIVWEGIRQRLSLLPLGVDVQSIDLSKDGNTLVLTANIGGQSNLFTYSLDELSREAPVLKQVTFSSGFKSNVQLSADGKEVYFLESGRIQSVNLDTKNVKPVAVTAEMAVDFNKEKLEVFRQAWELQNDGFYDDKFHGADWQAVKRTYEPLAAGAQTPDELRRILNLMVGELNASHSGVSGSTPLAFQVGRLGLRFDRSVYEKEGKLLVSEVVALSPAALAGSIKPGDYLLAVDGVSLNSNVSLEQQLENKVGKRVVLRVSSGSNNRDVVVKPVSQPVEKGLLYKQWVQQNREYVAKASGGKLGYVHMFDMGQGSLDQLYLDMDAENHAREGVVVDIRNNNGGFVNAYALDVLSRKGYMTMTVRGLPPAPARTQLGQRALDAPTILVTNQHSLSDAEDFSEGYRSLGLGKVVGEPTAGWIIYTSNITLFDGTVVRLPFIKITDNKGKNMELAPRPVDIPVSNTLGEKGRDQQLDTAVKELLLQVEKKS
ncbi:peptidase S41 [Flavisolibacter tropicus]|uniref:Tricorn protease homolog n=1 Tax=Flavisolibacter tropicus TaxID=1492898 RepID=A0A172U344_9BACT|nr:peptidase S41 [Flavisolibacter tropicus]